MTEPLLRRLHARGERLTVGALPWVAPVYRAMPQVDEVIEFPFQHGGLQLRARRAIAKQVQGHFDAAYVLPNSLKSALLPFLASIPRRVGYLGEARVGLLTHRLKNPKNKPPMVAFYSALSGDKQGLESDRPRLAPGDSQVDAALAATGLQPGGYYVFAPGANTVRPSVGPDHFAELARSLDRPARAARLGQGGAAVRRDRDAAGAGPVPQPRRQDLAAGCLRADRGARAVISNDSGLMHVAAAFGVPQVAVFGSSSPRHTPPLNEQAQVVWLKDDAVLPAAAGLLALLPARVPAGPLPLPERRHACTCPRGDQCSRSASPRS